VYKKHQKGYNTPLSTKKEGENHILYKFTY